VYGIVQQSGGHIWLYSESGFGTSFKIYLPCVDDAFEPLALVERKAPTKVASESVLVVEDSEAVRNMLCRILRINGYKVMEAPNGEAALKLFSEHAAILDMLISDVVMPEMSGIELASKLRESHPSMRVLLMSGYSGTAMTRHGELQSDFPFLEKPFNPDTVARKVREVLDQPTRAAAVSGRST
jgi:DNA-binding NtrC family response regulator